MTQNIPFATTSFHTNSSKFIILQWTVPRKTPHERVPKSIVKRFFHWFFNWNALKNTSTQFFLTFKVSKWFSGFRAFEKTQLCINWMRFHVLIDQSPHVLPKKTQVFVATKSCVFFRQHLWFSVDSHARPPLILSGVRFLESPESGEWFRYLVWQKKMRRNDFKAIWRKN